MPEKRQPKEITEQDVVELGKVTKELKKSRVIKYSEAGGGEMIIKDAREVIYPEAGGGEMVIKKENQIDTHRVELKKLRPVPKVKITYPADVVGFAREMEDFDREYFRVVWLDTKSRVIGVENISTGSISQAIIHPREAAKGAILANASGVVLIHNHPSGVPEPSREDDDVIGRLKKVFDLVGIKVIDALIIAKEGYYSYEATNRITTLQTTGGIMEREDIKDRLERLQSLRRIKISELEEERLSGKRKRLLDEIFDINKKIASLEKGTERIMEDDACSIAMKAAMETMSKYCGEGNEGDADEICKDIIGTQPGTTEHQNCVKKINEMLAKRLLYKEYNIWKFTKEADEMIRKLKLG